MSDPNQVVIQKSEYWIRVGLAINHTVKDVLLSILHNTFNDPSYNGLPTDPQQLYAALDGIRKSNTIPNNVLKKKQWAIILPPHPTNSAGCSNSKDFDITMIIVLIRHGTNITPPIGGWDVVTPHPSDKSVAAFCIFARELRNEFSHNKLPIIMSLVEFQNVYQRIEHITFGMCYFDNLKYIPYEDQLDEFKNGSLHPHMTSILDNVQKKASEIDKSKVDTTTFKAANGYLNFLVNNLKTCIEKESKIVEDFKAKLEKEKVVNDYRSNCAEQNVRKLFCKIDQEFSRDFDNINHTLGFVLEKIEIIHDDNLFIKQRLEDHDEKIQTLESKHIEPCAEERGDKYLNASAEVLNLVSSKIGKDWKRLADKLDLKYPILYQLQLNNEKNMMNCFQKRYIIWHELKKSLESIERHDIINMICDNLNLCSDEIHTTNHLGCVVRSHGSAEISEVNQQHQLKLLKEDDIITYISCGEKHTMILKEWDKTCIEYFQRYYEPQEKLLFPPQKCQNSFREILTKKIMSYLDPEDGNICLFSGYDLLNHCRLHFGSSETYKKLLKDLLISSDEELRSSKNRILLFNIKHKLILNIRITESTDISSIYREERAGRSDLKLLLFLNQRFIETTGITFTNVVLSPNICINDSSVCCKNCIVLDRSILNADEDTFKRWWKAHIIPKTKLKDKISDTCLLTGIISTIFGFMGTKQVNMEHTGCFPTFRRDNTAEGEEHIEITNLMFTYDQSRVIDHPALKKIVFGGFGAGKSLIGQCQLQDLARQEANTTNHTFYICGDDSSIIHLQMKDMVEEVKKSIPNPNFYSYNLRELAEVYLKRKKIPSISELFEEIHSKCHGTAHLIIDEFNLETLDCNQVNSLNTIFNRDEWKPSIVMLLPQSLEKKHIVISDGKEVSKNENTAYRCIDNIKCFTLSRHMRSTKSNFDFHKMSTTIITTAVTNSINHPSLHETTKVGNPFDSNASAAAARKEVTINSDVAEELFVKSSKSASNIESTNEFVPDKRTDDLFFQASVNLDELQVYKTSDCPNRTDTVYSSRECDNVGHGIAGKKPKFLYFDHTNTEAEACAKLILVLQKLFFADCETLFLCKIQRDFQLCLKLLKLLKKNFVNYHPLSGYRLVDRKGNILQDIPKGYDIITDNKGARGLEYQQVVVFIPSGNFNQQQAFLETISRCTSELFIIYTDQFYLNHPQQMPPVIHQVLSEAIHQNIIQECLICDCEIDDTDNVVNHTSDNGKDYFHINHNSGKYRELYSQANSLDSVQTSVEENNASPFDAPTGLKCTINKSGDKKFCKLTWNQNPFDFVVMKKHIHADHVEFTSKPTSSSFYTFEDMTEGEDYILSVSTYSNFGESIKTQLPWRHVDLFHVIRYNDFETLKTTIDIYPWRLYDEDDDGTTLYHLAVMFNKPSILQYMLCVDNKYMNKVNRWNQTPLYLASLKGSIDSVDLLLSHGADCSVMDEYGRTAYHVVCRGDFADLSITEKIKQMFLNKMNN